MGGWPRSIRRPTPSRSRCPAVACDTSPATTRSRPRGSAGHCSSAPSTARCCCSITWWSGSAPWGPCEPERPCVGVHPLFVRRGRQSEVPASGRLLVWSPIDYNGGAADIIYSVSVIEHLATPVRQAWLRRAIVLLRPGGHLLLTVDLAAPGEELWPFAEGRVVRPDHGTLTDLCREAVRGRVDRRFGGDRPRPARHPGRRGAHRRTQAGHGRRPS